MLSAAHYLEINLATLSRTSSRCAGVLVPDIPGDESLQLQEDHGGSLRQRFRGHRPLTHPAQDAHGHSQTL